MDGISTAVKDFAIGLIQDHIRARDEAGARSRISSSIVLNATGMH
jgi:hypothetical protein